VKCNAVSFLPVVFVSFKLDRFLIDLHEEALLLTWNNDVNTKLLRKDLVHARTVSVIDPVANGSALLLVLALAKEAPVVSLGA
jgi:hypothetical protein